MVSIHHVMTLCSVVMGYMLSQVLMACNYVLGFGSLQICQFKKHNFMHMFQQILFNVAT